MSSTGNGNPGKIIMILKSKVERLQSLVKNIDTLLARVQITFSKAAVDGVNR